MTNRELEGKKPERKPVITADKISGASVATLVVTIGWNIGANTWPGRACIWAAPWLVLFLPMMMATVINYLDDSLKNWQFNTQRKRLVELANREPNSATSRKIRAQLAAADLEHAERIRQRMRGTDPETSATE
ncbi:hypothetical protein [Streptomyces cylindrosporus]|uniref:Uncharacterized protein n=1 Tax=Streptomyces cylindrosporus TaxID=2927583 RepID=A0ABS9YGA0_9ACTN|nr:hypothetical protein [Streptomyces cylindrosporus]MCI3276268.1 hypothetical protein [Streptomyces cylindrosporus]